MNKLFNVYYTRKESTLEMSIGIYAQSEQQAREEIKKYLFSEETITRIEQVKPKD